MKDNQPIAYQATVSMKLERTVQVQQYEPLRMEIAISSDSQGGTSQTKEDMDRMVEDLSDYLYVKFNEEFNKHLAQVRCSYQ